MSGGSPIRWIGAVLLTVALAGCLPSPREGPDTKIDPWAARPTGNGSWESGFGTFMLDTARLRSGAKSSFGGGFGDFSMGDSDFIGRRNARYRFSVDRNTTAPEIHWLTYEVREIHRCRETRDLDREWARLAASGEIIAAYRADDPHYGEMHHYERVIDDYRLYGGSTDPRYRHRMFRREAGALFEYRDRIYNLLVFQVSAGTDAAAPDPAMRELLRNERENLLAAIRLQPGHGDRCAILATEPHFSANTAAINRALACAINPHRGHWPTFCTAPGMLESRTD